MLRAVTFAFALAVAAPAHACLTETKLTAQLVADAAETEMVHLPAAAGRPQALVGYLSYLRPAMTEDATGEAVHGAIVFVETKAGWRAFVPAYGETAVALYASTAGPEAFLVTQLQIEGPGQSFTVVRSRDGFASGACATLDFPPLLNNPGWAMEYLSPDGLQIDARGRGRLLASGEIDAETDAPVMTWWAYPTTSAGRRWGKPKRLPAATPPDPGPFAPVAAPPPAAVIDALKAAAG